MIYLHHHSIDNMRVLIFFFIFFFIFNILNANIKIVAKVKNETITSYELENKIRTLIFFEWSAP